MIIISICLGLFNMVSTNFWSIFFNFEIEKLDLPQYYQIGLTKITS